MVEDDGIEPPTPACKAGALPAELILHLPGNVLLSHRDKVPTTIGARELNFRVRYGNGCDLSAIITRLFKGIFLFNFKVNKFYILSKLDNIHIIWLSPRSISIRQLHMSPCFHLEPINLIIFQGSY